MEMVMIKDASKSLGVESHVLRYWEEELGIEIKRNSMGHRFYDERDIRMFQEVKFLRDKGFSLKDIKEGIEKQKDSKQDVSEDVSEDVKEIVVKEEEEVVVKSEPVCDLKIVDFKTAQLQNLMNKIVANALNENKDIITSSIKSEITTDVIKQFDTVIREKEEREEERFKKLDELLRQVQQSNLEVAATKAKGKMFGRKRK